MDSVVAEGAQSVVAAGGQSVVAEGAVRVERLRDGRDIVAVLRGRSSRAGRLVAVHVRAASSDGEDDHRSSSPARVAVVASRKVGGAVTRNRAKRLLREASMRVEWTPGTDVVLVARPACAQSTMPVVLAEVAELATRLVVTIAPTTAPTTA